MAKYYGIKNDYLKEIIKKINKEEYDKLLNDNISD